MVWQTNSVIHPVTGASQEYRQLIRGPDKDIWMLSFANELGQLAQGIRDIKGTNTIVFITKAEVPNNKRCTYGKINYDIKLEKTEKHRSRLTVG